MVDVTQIPLNAKIYENVLETLKEPLAIHFSESKFDNPYEKVASKKGNQEVFYDKFCFDFLRLFGIE